MCIGSERVDISGYKIQSSADGETELCVTIKGELMELEGSINFSVSQNEFCSKDSEVSARLNALTSESH